MKNCFGFDDEDSICEGEEENENEDSLFGLSRISPVASSTHIIAGRTLNSPSFASFSSSQLGKRDKPDRNVLKRDAPRRFALPPGMRVAKMETAFSGRAPIYNRSGTKALNKAVKSNKSKGGGAKKIKQQEFMTLSGDKVKINIDSGNREDFFG